MKTKSSYHRSENTFRFQTFTERLSGINIDVVRKIHKYSARPEDADTFFGEALEKWTDLNCTRHFVDFRQEIKSQVQSLAQLVYHQNDIIDALQRHLKVPASLALTPLLDLVVQLARDLQGDFYPFFEQFFSIIVGLLNSYHHDVEVLEQAFTCLAYLFKFLWRLMVKDIEVVFKLFAPLLGANYREYINTFAAESFAFLTRKVKSPEKLFHLMFKSLEDNPERVNGTGRLLFEMMRGVQKQFFSNVEKTMRMLLDNLTDTSLPQEEVSKCLIHMMEAMAKHTAPEHTQLVWKAMLDHTNQIQQKWKESRGAAKTCLAEGLERTLIVLQVWFKWKGGMLIVDVDPLVQMLCQLLSGGHVIDSCIQIQLDLTAHLLVSSRCIVPVIHRNRLLDLIFNGKQSNKLTFGFVRQIFDLEQFDKDVVGRLLRYCYKCCTTKTVSTKQDVLLILTELVLYKAPLPQSGLSLPDWRPYLLDFSMVQEKSKGKQLIQTYLLGILDDAVKKDDSSTEVTWAALVCLLQTRPVTAEDVTDKSMSLLAHLVSKLTAEECDDGNVPSQLLLVYQIVLLMIHTTEKEDFLDTFPPTALLQLLKGYPRQPSLLCAIDLYLSHVESLNNNFQVLNKDTFDTIFPYIQENLSSPYSQVRLLTLHILCQFELEMPKIEDDPDLEQPGVFHICLTAEQIIPSVQNYRERLVHLQRLDWTVVRHQLPVGPYTQVPLRYLLGSLYVNFKLLWEPTMTILQSHAVGMNKDDFWAVYGASIQQAAGRTEKELLQPKTVQPGINVGDRAESVSGSSISNLCGCIMDRLSGKDDRPDYINFRALLWRAMQKFPECCEPKSRLLAPALMRFLKNEYYPEDTSSAPTQDIRKDKPVQDGTLDESQMDQSEAMTEEVEKEDVEETEDSKKRTRRAANKVLVTHLQVFAKFRNPRSIYLESQLRDLYHELLSHRDLDVQKVAFECIMTYNYKYLAPYRENFERLLDDKSFKKEIVLFSIDEETSVVQKEHRPGLLPVLMRVLYGKMQTKTGKDTAGKAYSQLRKTLVLRFLAGLQQEELQFFMDLIFKPFEHLVSDDPVAKVKEIQETLDLSQVIPLRRQQGLLRTMEVMFDKLGHLLEKYLPSMLHVLVCLTASCAAMLDQRDQVHPKAIHNLKMVRQICLGRIQQFFEAFDNYPFSRGEVDALFIAAVWPQVDKLPHEGTYSPTPLLRLCHAWTDTPRYLPLLAKRDPDSAQLTTLPYICKLLVAKNVNSSVVTMVTDMIDNLLSIEDFQDKEEVGQIDIGCSVDVPLPAIDAGDPINYGTRLLLPHVSVIMQYLGTVVQQLKKDGAKRRALPVKELRILARLSEYVEDEEQCQLMVTLLLPFLNRGLQRSQDVEVDILKSVSNLITRVEQADQFLVSLARLFSILSSRASRTALCQVVQTIGKLNPGVSAVADIVTKLNAWDPRRVEEPDYLVRLDAYQDLVQQLQRDEDLPMALLLMTAHNCCFFLATTEDMSLRDNAAHCGQELIKYVARKADGKQMFSLLIQENLLPEVKTGLRNKGEVPRHEFLNLLSCLVKSFPQYHEFIDLSQLTDTDVEVDFFENIKHIQLHRRARALRRLSKMLAVKPIKTNCIVAYLLPVVTSFLSDEAYSKANNLLDAAVDTMGVICRCLPWPRYQLLLRYYLNKLPKDLQHQKLIVRLVVIILDNFHFDLRHSQGVVRNPDLPVVKGSGNEDSEADNNQTAAEGSDGKNGNTAAETEDVTDEAPGAEEEGEDEGYEGSTDTTSDMFQALPRPDGKVICAPGLASRIHRTIVNNIIPQLHRCLTQKAKSDDEHRKAKVTKYAEDEEVLRVPIALAMVKLLQGLPAQSLQQNLPGVLMKVCQFLKSRAKDIRGTARETLIKIVMSLGANYLSFVLKELRFSLTRGYQLHVLCYTVHALLKNLLPTLQSGDLDSITASLVQVFNEEIFGSVAEEKEVQGITSKLHEAKTSKSYESYTILARFVTNKCLSNIIQPLKEVLDHTHSHKTSRKVQEVLHKVGDGLVENKGLGVETLLTLVYGLTTEAMPLLMPKEREKPAKAPDPSHRPPSTLLLKPEPKRGGSKPKTHVKTNMHVIVDFGLQLLYMLLKRSLVVGSSKQHLEMLDPMVKTLTECLASKHVKVASTSLRCLAWILKLPLPALKEHIVAITNHLFVLLNSYASAGAAKADNFELVIMCFKTMTVLVRDVHYHTINSKQLQVLLGYAEQDLSDHSRQATAFTLLKAILSRKLVCDEINDVIQQVQKLSITADSAHVRLQSRQVVLQFMLDYPLGKKLKRHLEFYVSQLEYEHETGRESALEMLATMFNSFPQNLLLEYSGLFFLPLSSRLVNDDSTKCRKLSALAVKSLLEELNSEDRDRLFSMCVTWLQDRKVLVRRLAAVSCGLFVEVEAAKFERHLQGILGIIAQQVEPGKYEKVENAMTEKDLDHLLFSMLTLLSKILQECNIVRKPKWTDTLNDIWESVQSHLLHAHVWVRLVSCQLFGLLFAAWTPQEIFPSHTHEKEEVVEFLHEDTEQKLRDLSVTFIRQLETPELDQELADQIVKNLVFLAKALKLISTSPGQEMGNGDGNRELPAEGPDSGKVSRPVDVTWLIKRLCKEGRTEAAQHKSTSKRTCVVKWLAAVAVDLGRDQLPAYLSFMLPTLVREITDNSPNIDTSLKTLCQEVCDLMKTTAGLDSFTKEYAVAYKALSQKRDSRKRQRAMETVANPEVGAKRKMKKHLAKRDAKKRKIQEKRPTKMSKKKRLQSLAVLDL